MALNNEYNNHVDQLKKAKANYDKLSKEAEIAQKTFDSAKADPNVKPKDIAKVVTSACNLT